MRESYRDELVGVFGSPIDDNPTVIIQEAAFKTLNLPFRYLTIEVKPEDLEKAMDGIRVMNMKGINLTMPHKVKVLQYLDVIADDAKLMGAVNTVYVKDKKLYGENTDGKGFMLALTNGGINVKGKKIVMLGAGGAARAMSVELANAGASCIEIVNRGKERGEELCALLNEKTTLKAHFVLWEKTYKIPEDADILINSTSIGFDPNADQKPNIDYDTLKSSLIVCDVIPNNPHTPFLQEAKTRGCKTFDGLTMLVNQGLLGFRLWTGMDAPADVMTKALKEEFGIKD
ncbi:MAG: shikimate dehydrogenase [Treponema sp.]|jgi:shikimate dehydrogenase|nr:shikimate dehydrogenase [Treponema sp.]